MADIILGSGKLYWDQENGAGNLSGHEIYLAETPGLALTASPERVEDWSSDGKIAEKHLDVAVKLTRDISFSIKDITLTNLALFLIGTRADIVQAATPIIGEVLTNSSVQGTYLQIGVNASGARGMSAVVIDDDATPAVLDTDYSLDEALGRIYIIPGGGIVDGSVLDADYTPTVNTREQVTTDQLGAKFGALRFISDNTDGAERDYYWPKVSLNPDGELALKSRDSVQEMTFAGAVATRTGFAQVYIDARAV
ncbi:MAG: hypothetical protein GQ468_05365 [Candidatus Scalindua sp.]|nr:hypothetical protein [Candidatus Scalindua sp.]